MWLFPGGVCYSALESEYLMSLILMVRPFSYWLPYWTEHTKIDPCNRLALKAWCALGMLISYQCFTSHILYLTHLLSLVPWLQIIFTMAADNLHSNCGWPLTWWTMTTGDLLVAPWVFFLSWHPASLTLLHIEKWAAPAYVHSSVLHKPSHYLLPML